MTKNGQTLIPKVIMQSIDKLVSGSLRGIKSLYFLCKQIDLNIINQKSVQRNHWYFNQSLCL